MDLLDAIGQVGTAADKITGGRALRGVLAGKGREALSFVPFSDSMGLTDAHDATSGRDLLDSYGVTKKGDTSFGSHALGFLADNVLSPGNLLGAYGAFKAAPTVAKGIGSAAKAASGLDLFDHIGQAGKGLGRFLGGEGGHLNLKFDGMPGPPKGMPRTDPEWINNRTWFHGSGTPGLSAEELTPFRTSVDTEGPGIYHTSDPGEASWFAKTRGGRPGRTPTIYQSQPNVSSALDTRLPMDRQTADVLGGLWQDKARIISEETGEPIPDFFRHGEATTQEALDRLIPVVNEAASIGGVKSRRQRDLLEALKSRLGHDALISTEHNAGIVAPHHLVMLDPNDALGIGRSSPYRTWQAIKNFAADERGSLDLRAFSPNPIDKAAQKTGLETPGPLNDLFGEIQSRMGGDRNRALAAWHHGPQYESDAADLAQRVLSSSGGGALSQLFDDPAAATRLARELPPGSSLLGSGVEGAAFETPSGNVVRVSRTEGNPVARMDIPEMVMPFRSTHSQGRTIEHLPKITPMSKLVSDKNRLNIRQMLQYADPTDPMHVAAARDLVGGFEAAKRVNGAIGDIPWQARGIDPWDMHDANYGLTNDGRFAILDPGAIQLSGAEDQTNAFARAMLAEEGSGFLQGSPLYQGVTSAEMAPDQFRFPVETPKGMSPMHLLAARDDARRAGIPDLVRSYLESSSSIPSGGVLAPGTSQFDARKFYDMMQHVGTGSTGLINSTDAC